MIPPLVEEAIVTLSVDGAKKLQWRCTPTNLEALAIGRLYIENAISAADHVHLVIDGDSSSEIRVDARVGRSSLLRAAGERELPIPEPEIFTELFRTLFNAVDARHEQGGMHAAAATDGQRILVQMEDVGRHNTVDKITGALLLQGLSPADHGLLTSSRVSGEIADKAARAGFAWLASRSIPTTLAVRFARAAHMPIIGRAAGKGAFIYQ
jgi:FdhD protein